MKRKIILLTVFTIISFHLAHAGVFSDTVQEWAEEVEDIYPYAAGLAFLVFCLFNYDHFFGKNKDYKAGATNIAWFLGINVLVIAAYASITGSSL